MLKDANKKISPAVQKNRPVLHQEPLTRLISNKTQKDHVWAAPRGSAKI